jgi:hypothetical protein
MTGGMLLILTKTAASLAPSAKHQEVLDAHFTSEDQKKWRTFRRALRAKSFAAAVKQDDRADPKLKRFAEMMSKHYTDKGGPSFKTPGSKGEYTVKFHKDVNRFSCSCPDWAYTKSHRRGGTDVDCKHIEKVRYDLKNDGISLEKEKKAGLLNGLIGTVGTKAKAEHYDDEAWKARMAAHTVRKAFPKHAEIMGRAARAVLNS